MRLLFIVALLAVSTGVLAQSATPEEPDAVITLDPQELPAHNAVTSTFVDIDFVLAEEVFVGPQVIEAEIREGHQMAALYLSLASKVNTRVRIVLSNPEEVKTSQDISNFALFQGSQQAINFVAYSPHSGTISVLNENDVVLAVVPYTVTQENPLRHSVSGSVNLGGTFNLSYSLSSRDGWNTSVGVGVNTEGEFTGSISGSYSW